MDDHSALNQIKLLKQLSIVSSQLDIELLLLHLLEIDRNTLYRDNPLLTDDIVNKLKELTQRRENGEPLAYLVNNTEFWNLSLYVDQNVLVPRPETEILVQKVLEIFDKKKIRVLDLGTGSGAIGLSLAKERANWEVVCSDLSYEALKVTSKNMIRNSLDVSLVNSNWSSAFKNQYFDVIVSNPPYIPTEDIKGLAPEVAKHEPIIALDGGTDGLDCYRDLIRLAAPRVRDGIIVEIGLGQEESVAQLMEDAGLIDIEHHTDLTDRIRVVSARKPSA